MTKNFLSKLLFGSALFLSLSLFNACNEATEGDGDPGSDSRGIDDTIGTKHNKATPPYSDSPAADHKEY